MIILPRTYATVPNYYITNNKLTLMKMEKEMKYEAPEVEVLEVEIEKGFAGSDQWVPGEDGGEIN